MKITFLGTSHGVPAADRCCACTMLEVNGATYFIDAGAPLIDILLRRGTDLNTIRALFTTHLHGDHVNGVLAFADLINWYFKTARAQIWLTEEEGVSLFKQLITLTEGMAIDEARVDFRTEKPGLFYEDENLRVTAIPTQHMAYASRPSYALLLEAEGKRVLFTGDLSQNLDKGDFPACAMSEPIDLMVMEMAHFGVKEAAPCLEKCTAKQLYVQHVFPLDKYPQIEALSGKYGYPIFTPRDGDEMEL